MPDKIVILTTGQPSTNPRMVKEYQALKSAGYEVKVFYSFWQHWAVESDKHLFATNEIDAKDFKLVGGQQGALSASYFFSRLSQKWSRFVYRRFGKITLAATGRTTKLLVKAAVDHKAGLYIAHNLGALPAAVIAAKKHNAKAGFDAEDFHRGEHSHTHSPAAKLTIAIEDGYIPQCNYVTAASPQIANAYRELYKSPPVTVINNVFSRKFLQPNTKNSSGSLTLFWFSQTIGPHRGLETVVKAMSLVEDRCDIQLCLLGNVSAGFDKDLLSKVQKKERIHFMPPVTPEKVFKLSAAFDIGLSLEVPDFVNRDLCLTNKLFTYLLAGNCLVLSETKAQKEFASQIGCKNLFEAGNANGLAGILEHLYNNRDEVNNAKKKSLQLAENSFNWENESYKLTALVADVLQESRALQNDKH